MWEPLFDRSSASGPPDDPWTKRSFAASQSCSTPGSFIASDVPADIACIAREAGPNQPRYAFTSRRRGASLGSAKCSELPTETAGRSFSPTWKLRRRLALRSLWTRPSQNLNAGDPSDVIIVARVPPLGEEPLPVK